MRYGYLPSSVASTTYWQQIWSNRGGFHSLTLHLYHLIQAQDAVNLTLLDRLHPTADAGHLCGNREGCLKGAREGVLGDIGRWFTNEGSRRVFWLNGLAGTGKSIIAQSFTETASANGKLGASFFCLRDFEDRSNLQKISPALAFQLTCHYPHFRQNLLDVVKEGPHVGHESLCSQMEKLLVGPLRATQAAQQPQGPFLDLTGLPSTVPGPLSPLSSLARVSDSTSSRTPSPPLQLSNLPPPTTFLPSLNPFSLPPYDSGTLEPAPYWNVVG